ASLQRQMEMRQQSWLAGDQFKQRIVDLNAVERGQAQAMQPGLRREQALAQRAETACVVSNIDPGEDDFPRSAVNFTRYCIANSLKRQRNTGPARLPDRAESAAMIAPRLHRDKAADVAEEAGGDRRHDVIRH